MRIWSVLVSCGVWVLGAYHVAAESAVLRVRAVDAATGKPTGGHIWLTDDPPGEAAGPYRGEGLWTGGNYASFPSGEFSLELPDKRCRVTIEKGQEYLPFVLNLDPEPGRIIERDVRLKRYIDMKARGYWAGDMHIHRGPAKTAEQMLVEGIHAAFPLTWWNKPRFADEMAEWAARSKDGRTVAIDDEHAMALYNMEYEGQPYGAIHLLNLKSFIHGDHTPAADLCQRAVAGGGMAYPEKPIWYSTLDVVVAGGTRVLEVLNNHFLYPHAINNPAWGVGRESFAPWRTYSKDFIGFAEYCCDQYYVYLNCGYRLTAVAGTADGVLGSPIGLNRVYVRLDGPFSLDKWIDGVYAGRTFVTNGPMLWMTVGKGTKLSATEEEARRRDEGTKGKEGGAQPGRRDRGAGPGGVVRVSGKGEVRVRVKVLSARPIERVEVISNGEVVGRASPSGPAREDGAFAYEHTWTVPVERSGWIAGRCFSDVRPNRVRMAHTSPVWIEIPGKPRRVSNALVDLYAKRFDWWIDWARRNKPGAVTHYETAKANFIAHAKGESRGE